MTLGFICMLWLCGKNNNIAHYFRKKNIISSKFKCEAEHSKRSVVYSCDFDLSPHIQHIPRWAVWTTKYESNITKT